MLSKKTILVAKPNYYNYMHFITLYHSNDEGSGKCSLVHGSGQSVCLDTETDYIIKDNIFTITNKNSVKCNIPFTIEKGCFVTAEMEAFWRQTPESWDVYVSDTKYTFEDDPISVYENNEKREPTLYSLLNKVEKDTVFYANICQKQTKDLSEEELEALKITHLQLYEAFKSS